eukprot:135728_1
MAEEFQSISDIIFSAIFSSLTTVCLPYPIDLIRTQQQTNVLKHNHMWRGFHSIYYKQGMRGLYKGVSWVFLFDAPATICYFLTYTKCKQLFSYFGYYERGNAALSSSMIEGLSAIPATITGCLFWTPQDTIVQKAQCTQYYNTPKRIAQAILLREGLSGFWKGYVINLCTLGPMCALFLINYEFSKRTYVHFMHGGFINNETTDPDHNKMVNKDLETVPCIVLSSIWSGVLAIYATQPLDTLRCRIQASGTRGLHFAYIHRIPHSGKHLSIRHHISIAYRNAYGLVAVEGIKVLLRKGFFARLLSTGPDLMGGIISYELFIKWLSGTYI